MSLSARRASDGAAGTVQGRAPTRFWRWRTLVLGVAALAVAGGLGAYLTTPRSPTAVTGAAGGSDGVVFQGTGPGKGLPKLADGARAPGFSLARLGGGPPVTLAAERGHPVVLNFFASWCSDCRAELKAFADVSNALHASHGGVRFLGIDTNDPATAKAQGLLATAGDRYPVGVDPHATVANSRYYVEALPVTVFIDVTGHIAGEAFGAQTVGSLTSWVRALETSADRSRKSRGG